MRKDICKNGHKLIDDNVYIRPDTGARQCRVSLSRGGHHEDSNLVLSCPPCNLEKGIKTDVEYLRRR